MPRKILIVASSIVAVALTAAMLFVTLFTNHVFVTTPSMYPTVPPGSLVFIQKEPRYHVGDVIEFHGNGLVFMHRIVKISPAGYITTKGDNPENVPDVFDPGVTSADVIGRAVYSVKWAGFPELILRHPVYGLSWLRAELGLRGRLFVLLLSAIVAFATLGDRPRGRGRRRRGSQPHVSPSVG